MGRVNKNKKINRKMKIISSNENDLEKVSSSNITKHKVNIKDYNYEEEDVIIPMINRDIDLMKEQYEMISKKHNDLLGISSDLKFKIVTDQPTRYETLYSSFNKLYDNDEAHNSTSRSKRVKKVSNKKGGRNSNLETVLNNSAAKKSVLGKMHLDNILNFIEKSSIMLPGFDLRRGFRIPTNPSAKSSILKTVLQEHLFAADVVNESLKREKIREDKFGKIFPYEYSENLEQVIFHLILPGIGSYESPEIELIILEKSLSLFIDNFHGVDYLFEQRYLAGKVTEKNSYFIIKSDTIYLFVTKKEKGLWKQFEWFTSDIKEVWELEMKNVMKDLPPLVKEEMISSKLTIETIWKLALVMASGWVNFRQLPPDMNHAKRSFESLRDMISYYKAFISIVPHSKSHLIILGGAIYVELISITFKNKRLKSKIALKKKPSNLKITLTVENKRTSKYVKEITNIMEMSVLEAVKGLKLYWQDKFDQACDQFCLAIDLFQHPKFFYLRSLCLFEMKKYPEAYSDSIRVLRNLGPIAGFDCLLNCLHFEIIQLNFIPVLDLSYSLPYVLEQVSENRRTELMSIRRLCLRRLRLMFTAHRLTLRKKYELAIPFYEQLSQSRLAFLEMLSVLYLVCKKYKEAYETANYINDRIAKNDMHKYIMGMSAYYMIDIKNSIENLSVIGNKGIVYINYVTEKVLAVKHFMDEGDKHLQSGNLRNAINSYFLILGHDEKNVRLLSLVWFWIGYLQFRLKDYLGASNSLLYSLNLNGDSAMAFRLRKIAIEKQKNNVHKKVEYKRW